VQPGGRELVEALSHDQADAVLCILADRLRWAASDAALVARLDGDQFGVLVAGEAAADPAAVARAVHRPLDAPFEVGRLTLAVDGSVGVAAHADDPDDPRSLLARARRAMRVARDERSGFHVDDAPAAAPRPRRFELAGEFLRALERGEVGFLYQPQVDLRTGRPVAAEALVRWAHPVRGVLGPAEFLPAIERSPLIRRLALAALEHATASAAAWRAEGLELTVAVNLTVLNLLDLGIAHDVARLLARHGLPPRLLTLEVTEEALMLHRTRAAGVLGGLRAMGVRIAVDDFGTGYSSLAYLQRLPLDELKIDRAFVRDVVGNRRDAAIVRAVVDLAHHLELRAVGEGVERPEQAKALRAAGCDVGQGFGFGEPMPAAALTGWAAALAA